jgi:cellulose synthase/poly-beta-1,6-N-acetylglucosamine synthase-like glycosyltransferase
MKFIFWASLIIIVYTYIVYPALVYLLSLFFRKLVKKQEIYPTVSILIAAYNEEKNIEGKIKSILELDYPKEKIEVLIGSDGSTDKTDELVSKFTNERFSLLRLLVREGKPAVLNSLAKQAKNEILVFTDARQKLERSSLKELVGNFADKTIGSVSAQLVFEDGTGNKGVGVYWNYEKFIRISESKIGSMLGATGAMYAIRKNLFSNLPNDLILDDVFVPLKIVAVGFRAIFEPKAIIFDSITRDAGQEFQRKTRTLAGNFQIFGLFKSLFNPVKSPVAIQLFSHKFLRLLVPFLMIIIFIANIAMLDKNTYLLIFALQVLFYFVAFLGSMLKKNNRMFDIPHMFCVMNSAAVIGLYRFLFNKQAVTWEKTA